MNFNEFKPGVIQPGMEQLIEAGDTLEITDKDGHIFAVTAIEGTATLDFFKAFDTWLTMNGAGVVGPSLLTAYRDMIDKFHKLPLRVQRELPSWKNLGVNV